MYRKILVTLENGPADKRLVPHVRELAKLIGAELLLVHVADGWAARNFVRNELAESDEMKADRDYLDRTADELRTAGLKVEATLALGNPPDEIVKVAADSGCDLIAMASHGHKIIGDIVHGSTITKVRHNTEVTLLVVSAKEA